MKDRLSGRFRHLLLFLGFLILIIHRTDVFLLCVALFSNIFCCFCCCRFCFPFHTRLVGDCVCILFPFIFRFKCFIIFTSTKRERERVCVFSYDFVSLQTFIALFVWSSELSPHIPFLFIVHMFIHTTTDGTLQIVHHSWIWIDLNSFRWTSNERCTIFD